MMPMPRRIEGYAIVSEDGMLANAAGIMPDSLKLEADQRFFERGLDGVDVVVHGRHSHEGQQRSNLRRRLILTHQIATIAARQMTRRCSGTRPGLRSSRPWLCSGRQTAMSVSLAVPMYSGCSWTAMTFSTCRGRPVCGCPVGDRSFLGSRRRLQRKCLQAMASIAARGRCLIRQKAWRSSLGNVQTPTNQLIESSSSFEPAIAGGLPVNLRWPPG
jgi:hypothetical protein